MVLRFTCNRHPSRQRVVVDGGTTSPPQIHYNSERSWSDYEPAYKCGYSKYDSYAGKKFEDVENDLERGWDATKANSNLAWNEARGAVKDGWHYIERAMPGDADGDGR